MIYPINTISDLMDFSKSFEGKTLNEINNEIKFKDNTSRIITKGTIGNFIEKDIFNIKKNSLAEPDIPSLNVEIKTVPLKYNKDRTKLSVKEPLSLNIINYSKEYKNTFKESSIYKKNKKILFFCYIHDKLKDRSNYIIKYVFLWEITDNVINELLPDYNKIIEKIKNGKAHEIHQTEHKYLTLCPKHNGDYKNPNDTKSKTKQPFSNVPAEIRAFRFKNKYMNLIIRRMLGKEETMTGWKY